MKAPYVIAILAIGIVTACWCAPQSAKQPTGAESQGGTDAALKQLQSFASYLEETKQTNALRRFNDYMNASIAMQNTADLGLTLAILQRLRDGQTNAAFQLLEQRLDANIVGFAAAYREMPVSAREDLSLKPLQYA